ncbi:MAG: Hsp20/alpha crystallin family protein [Planctomycetota bacterium]
MNNPNTNENQDAHVERTHERRHWTPRADIYENVEAFVLMADVPGADESSIDVTIEQQVLSITANVPPREQSAGQLVYAEFEEGDWTRSFRIGNDVDASNVQASIKNGVLRVSVPKKKAAHRKIAVRSE